MLHAIRVYAQSLRQNALRRNAALKSKGAGREWITMSNSLSTFESMLSAPFDSQKAPELLAIRDLVRHWRFYGSPLS